MYLRISNDDIEKPEDKDSASIVNQRHLLLGDYLIERGKTEGGMATTIEYGSDTFKTWEDIIEFFDRMGGQ
jgi:hypothetical protein